MSETAIPAVATAFCMWCGTDLRGKQVFFCSDRCRSAAWDEKHPRIEVLPSRNQTSVKRELKVRKLMDRLYQGPARTWDLMLVGGSGFSSRLHELREELIRFGWGISCDEDDDGATYTLEAL